jgi:hypothetical protein
MLKKEGSDVSQMGKYLREVIDRAIDELNEEWELSRWGKGGVA